MTKFNVNTLLNKPVLTGAEVEIINFHFKKKNLEDLDAVKSYLIKPLEEFTNLLGIEATFQVSFYDGYEKIFFSSEDLFEAIEKFQEFNLKYYNKPTDSGAYVHLFVGDVVYLRNPPFSDIRVKDDSVALSYPWTTPRQEGIMLERAEFEKNHTKEEMYDYAKDQYTRWLNSPF